MEKGIFGRYKHPKFLAAQCQTSSVRYLGDPHSFRCRGLCQEIIITCQGKVEMSPGWQSRNVPFCRGL